MDSKEPSMHNATASSDPTGPEFSYAKQFGMPQLDNATDVFSFFCSGAVIFGGLIPYIPQYIKIKHSMNSDGFSTYVCLTLLLANILRIMFWFGHPFETPLLIQSFVMITGMIAMMELCVRVKKTKSPYVISGATLRSGSSTRRRGNMGKHSSHVQEDVDETRPLISSENNQPSVISSISLVPSDIVSSSSLHSAVDQVLNCVDAPVGVSDDFQIQRDISIMSHQQYQSTSPIARTHTDLQDSGENTESDKCNFWEWNNLFSYIKFLSIFTLLLGILTYMLIRNAVYIEGLGFVAVFTESMLGMPQLMRNYRKKSTLGMSVEMVIMWLSGDLFKTLYFILRHAPKQFFICGAIQVTVDIFILAQVLWYRKPGILYSKLPES